jgi:SAM-dependent methyltransferase
MFLDFFIIKTRILGLLKGKFKSSDIILDMSCGEKPYYHKSIKAKIISTDIKHTKKTHIVSDAASLPLKKDKFDGIVCINSLYYYNNPFIAIKEFSRILKKNGKLIIMTPFIYPIHDAPDDKYRFTEYGIKELLKNDFDIKEIKTIGGIFNIPAVFFHSLIKGIPLLMPKSLRKLIRFLLSIVLYPFYILAQLISLLDFLDKSRRWPTYYFVIAMKR